MSSEDLKVMRAQLARYWLELSQLDLTEQAETVLRQAHELVLLERLGGGQSEPDTARTLLAELCEAADKARQCHRTYLADRSLLRKRIQGLQLAIIRIQTEDNVDGTLPWPPAT